MNNSNSKRENLLILVPQSLRHAKTRLSSIESQPKKVVDDVVIVVVVVGLVVAVVIN